MSMRGANYPRYVTVYDELLSRIQSGQYRPGDQLPGENELSKSFAVSRNTLRQAILLLHEDGYVTMRQGKGTFVQQKTVPHKVSLEKLVNPLQSLAINPVDHVETQLEIRKISPKNQEIFRLDTSRLLVLVETVYYSAGNQIGCGLAFIPYDHFAAERIPLDDMEAVGSFYNALITRNGLIAESNLRIVNPRHPVTELLGATSQETLFMLDEVIHTPDSDVVLTQKLFFRPNAYEITIIRRNT